MIYSRSIKKCARPIDGVGEQGPESSFIKVLGIKVCILWACIVIFNGFRGQGMYIVCVTKQLPWTLKPLKITIQATVSWSKINEMKISLLQSINFS